MSQPNSGKVSIPLKDIWFVLWNRKKMIGLIVLFFVAVSATAASISNVQNKMHPRYVTSAAIVVVSENKTGSFAGNSENPSYDEVLLAQKMADSVVYVITSDKVLDPVIESLELKQTQAKELKAAIHAEQYKDSQIINIDLTWYDPEEGERILTALTSVLPDILIDSLKIGNAEVVDFPSAAVRESGINIPLVVAVAFIVGLLTGILLYLLLLIFRPTFLSGEDLEDTLELPLLGEITADKNIHSLPQYELIEKGEQHLSGQFIEQTAFCAHIMRNMLEKEGQKTIFATSAIANEGKTTFAAVMAWQLSRLQKKVLLLDLDTRKPSLGRYFMRTLDKSRTINAVSKGEIAAEDACVKVNEYLYILPGYLEKARVRIENELVEQLAALTDGYDYVIIDCPPVGLVSDVMHLKRFCGKAVLVVEQGKAWQGLVADCANRLEKAGISILGSVLNKVNIRTPANRYYYRNYGSDEYYHGESAGKNAGGRSRTAHKKK